MDRKPVASSLRSHHLPATGSTIADTLAEHAAAHPDRPAIVGTGFVPLSFRNLNLQITSVRDQLRAADLGPASRIGILVPSGPEAAVLGIAVCSNAIAVPLNAALTANELEADLMLLDAIVVPAWLKTPASIAGAGASLSVFKISKAADSLSTISLSRTHGARSMRRTSSDVAASPVALLLRTSGTTGARKMVSVTHGNLIEMARKMLHWFDLCSNDRCACIVPLHYAQGFKSSVLVPLLLGGSVALPSDWHSDGVTDWLADLRPTWLSASPTILRTFLERFRSDGEKRRHSLRFILSSSSYLPDALRTELEISLGIPILEFYGLTEAGVMAANPAPPARGKPGTAGLIARHQLAIRTHDGQLAPIGQVGEITVQGPSVTPGYFDDTDGSVTAFPDGWLSTGDLGFVDADGFLTITGRTKELINRGGEKISPYEVEKALLLHPSVVEAAAFPVPHSRLGEDVAAAAVLRPPADTSPAELREFLCQHLTASKVPQRVFVLDNLPKGQTDKISRLQLAKDMEGRNQPTVASPNLLELQITEVWQRLIGRDDIGVSTNFFEAGGDSLLAAQMLLEVEAIAGRSLPQGALATASTIADLAKTITMAVPQESAVVTCAKRGSKLPFFFCHGDYDSRGFYALKLAKLLAPDQPVFLLHPDRSVASGAPTTMETTAQSYLDHLIAVQPSGMFRIGGYCNGGLLAWEIAHQLESSGRRVELVVLIDTFSLNGRLPLRAVRQSLRLVTGILRGKSGERLRKVVMRSLWRIVGLTDATSIDWRLPFRAVQQSLRLVTRILQRKCGERLQQVVMRSPSAVRSVAYSVMPKPKPAVRPNPSRDAYFDLMSSYHPPNIDSTVVCLVSDQNSPQRYSPSPWKRLARNVHYQHIAGEHRTCITIHARRLANVLSAVLESGVDKPPKASVDQTNS